MSQRKFEGGDDSDLATAAAHAAATGTNPHAVAQSDVGLGGTPPSSATDAGSAGDIRWDADYLYVCTATDTWKRVAIASW